MQNAPPAPAGAGAGGLGYEIMGAVKIKDGVFIGDELAAQDLEFVVANKVTHIINCCGRNVPNHWESIGVVYLTYYWVDNENQIILDNKDVVANECFHFLEEALGNAESVLIHSVRGQSRSCVVLAGYMMRKYCWGLRKSMDFLTSRRPDISLKPAFLQQLSQYERRLVATSNKKFTVDWSDMPNPTTLDGDELLLRNTYMNSQIENLSSKADSSKSGLSGHKRRLEWSDGGNDDKGKLEKGGDRPHCKTGHNGQFILTPIIKAVGPVAPASNAAPIPAPLPAVVPSVNHAPEPAPMISAPKVAPVPSHIIEEESQPLPATPTPPIVEAPPAPPIVKHDPAPILSAPQSSASSSTKWRKQPFPTAPADLGAKQDLQAPSSGSSFFSRLSETEGSNAGSGTLSPRSSTSTTRPSSSGQRPSSRQQEEPNTVWLTRNRIANDKDAYPRRREASPKVERYNEQGMRQPVRGDSPMRQQRQRDGSVGRSSSYDARSGGSPHRYDYGQQRATVTSRDLGGSSNLGGLLGSLRTSGPMKGPSVSSAAGRMGIGMSAFRQSGPVKAHRSAAPEMFADARKSTRPSTAPSTRVTPGGVFTTQYGQYRPNSPLLRSSTHSRPASPITGRPASPSRNTLVSSAGRPVSPSRGIISTGSALGMNFRTKSLSSHMRRAPSPTPAFNRAPSPSRPRWRM